MTAPQDHPHQTSTQPAGGTFSIYRRGGESLTYRHDRVLLRSSEPGVNWAINWANHERKPHHDRTS